jgi:hypothetical protein
VLRQLSEESQAVFVQVRRGVVRVQLPPPKWVNEMAARDNPVDKWGSMLSDQVRQRLTQEREDAKAGRYAPVGVEVQPTGAPTTQPQAAATWQMKQLAGSDTVIFESNDAAGILPTAIQIHTGGERTPDGRINPGGAPQMVLAPTGNFAPNNVGLVIDAAGHVMVPLYVEKETVGENVRVSVGDGPVESATFVASDRQTNVTVLKLPEASGTRNVIQLADKRPAEGSLVLLLAPNSGSAQWLVWNEAQQNVSGVVVTVDGAVAGFARFGQFLSARSCKPVVEQLIESGKVKRARLGVAVRQVGRDDPAREQTAGLGNRPALRVEQVMPKSAAANAGIQRGDLILSLAGELVGDPASLGAALANRTGSTAVHLMRGSEAIDVDVDLAGELEK